MAGCFIAGKHSTIGLTNRQAFNSRLRLNLFGDSLQGYVQVQCFVNIRAP